MEEARKLVTDREFFKLTNRKQFLRFLLLTVLKRRGLGVYDPRDMIYAHLGIAGEVMHRGAYTEEIIKVCRRSVKLDVFNTRL